MNSDNVKMVTVKLVDEFRTVASVSMPCNTGVVNIKKETMMERKVFTYKDVEEAKKWIGKRGRFSDSLESCEVGTNGLDYDLYGGVLTKVSTSGSRRFTADNHAGHFQFFSPDPEPVEKWVPFTSEDWELFMGRTVSMKPPKGHIPNSFLVVFCNQVELVLGTSCTVMYTELLEDFTFMDGSPCGKKVVE